MLRDDWEVAEEGSGGSSSSSEGDGVLGEDAGFGLVLCAGDGVFREGAFAWLGTGCNKVGDTCGTRGDPVASNSGRFAAEDKLGGHN